MFFSHSKFTKLESTIKSTIIDKNHLKVSPKVLLRVPFLNEKITANYSFSWVRGEL